MSRSICGLISRWFLKLFQLLWNGLAEVVENSLRSLQVGNSAVSESLAQSEPPGEPIQRTREALMFLEILQLSHSGDAGDAFNADYHGTRYDVAFGGIFIRASRMANRPPGGSQAVSGFRKIDARPFLFRQLRMVRPFGCRGIFQPTTVRGDQPGLYSRENSRWEVSGNRRTFWRHTVANRCHR